MLSSEPTYALPLREELQDKISTLSLQEKEMLLGWLKANVKESKQQKIKVEVPLKKGREALETHQAGTTIYRLEKVKCGKKKCKCNKGNLHGPYWYAYHWNGKKMTSSYIGKVLDEETASQIAASSNSNPSTSDPDGKAAPTETVVTS